MTALTPLSRPTRSVLPRIRVQSESIPFITRHAQPGLRRRMECSLCSLLYSAHKALSGCVKSAGSFFLLFGRFRHDTTHDLYFDNVPFEHFK